MNKEQEELLDEAYENFVKSIENNRPEGYVRKVMTKSEFMKESNFNKDFREYWGLKIEERELSDDEIVEYYYKHIKPNNKWKKNGNSYYYYSENNNMWFAHSGSDIFFGMRPNCPTRAITITYNDKTIESYE